MNMDRSLSTPPAARLPVTELVTEGGARIVIAVGGGLAEAGAREIGEDKVGVDLAG